MFKKRAARPHGMWPVAAYFFANTAFAHSFYDRYDLPIPLSFFLWGAALVVALTFFCMVFLAPPAQQKSAVSEVVNLAVLPPYAYVMRALAALLLILTITAGLVGTANPLMNLAPSFVWVTWWVGFALISAIFGNIWPWFDPIAALYDLLKKIGLFPADPHSQALAVAAKPYALWLATFLLLMWSWLEVVYPIALVPFNLGVFLLTWTIVSLLGMRLLGRAVWQLQFDFFAIYFAAIATVSRTAQRTAMQPFAKHLSYVGFVMAMLASVMFDGLHGNPIWSSIDEALTGIALAGNPYFSGTLGLFLVWLTFMLSYLACTGRNAALFAPTLIPIGVAYLVAHNFSNVVTQGQNVIYLLSDPFGSGWNLLGTKDFKPSTDWLNAKFSWYLAVSSIVMGHVTAVWKAHSAAQTLCTGRWAVIKYTLPLTLLMIAYTLLSLLVIAEPLIGN